MTTAIDTNVIASLIDNRGEDSELAKRLLEVAAASSLLLIAGPVYAELRGFRGRTEGYLDRFLADTYIRVDWDMGEAVWRLAGDANQAFSARRRRQNLQAPRRILADFLIGAHALVNQYTLLTLDQHHYRAAFPKLKLQRSDS